LFKKLSTDDVTKLDKSKGFTPLKIKLFKNKNLSLRVGFSIKLYGRLSILLSQKSQTALKKLLY
jgi:hypothetical protein